MTDRFRVVTAGIITRNGEVLIGKKEGDEEHPIGGQWHFPGGHLDSGEDVREAVKREIKEETGLEVETHQIVDIYTPEDRDMVRVLFHCAAEDGDAEAGDDISEVKWVDPEDLEDELGESDAANLERTEVSKFVEKLVKTPYF